MFTIHVQITVHGYIYCKKNIFYGNEVGRALRGTRQGPVLKYLYLTPNNLENKMI